MKQKTWFITGASKGLGFALVKKILQSGDKVAATTRNITDLEKVVDAGSDVFLPLSMNLTDEADVAKGIKAAFDHFGSIDVVVNNAGYGLVGALEELTDAETRQNFEINVYGSLNVIRNVLPFMRQQQSGHIFNISSIGGFTGSFPGFGIYCATKFAMQGFSESLATEVKPFGIGITIVSPGYFRTDFLTASSLGVPANPMDIYRNVREVQAMHQQAINGNQMGDPDKAARVMMEVAAMAEPPVHLFLGQDAYDLAGQKINAVQKDMARMEAIAVATGFDQ
jgi:NAD(P)-dependent dehydrogenase (short-subunit alcohol dehydrogenase family)